MEWGIIYKYIHMQIVKVVKMYAGVQKYIYDDSYEYA